VNGIDEATFMKLTVAIPTYNRAETLARTLNDLRMQYRESVAIIVSDNNSDDNTFDIVQEFKKTMPYLSYNKNPQNIGFDGQILKLYSLTKTPYVWFLSDDDPVEANAIDSILKVLHEFTPTVALFKHSYLDGPTRKKSIHPSWLTHNHMIQEFQSDEDYLKFLSAIFVSTLVLKKVPDINENMLVKYAGLGMVHLTLSLLLLSKSFRFCLMTPVIVQHYQARAYGDVLDQFLLNVFYAVDIPGLSFDTSPFKRVILSNNFIPMCKLLLSWKVGRDNILLPPRWSKICKVFSVFGLSSVSKILYLTICLTVPRFIVKLAYQTRLIWRHGLKQGMKIYADQTERKFDYNQIKFLETDFQPPNSLKNYCNKVLSYCEDLTVAAPINTVKWLNEILKIPDFYDRLGEKNKIQLTPVLDSSFRALIDITTEYRRAASFTDLGKEEKSAIQKLNRAILEKINLSGT
jgi:glycosyltransferase involved in cell wall biosynthesis